jgi:stearoyl-CoA desaturase (delta-9 desaturase)
MDVLKKINWATAIFLVLTPVVSVVWGGVHLRLFGISAVEVLLCLVFVSLTGFSITAGYHRHFAHGAYECRRFVQVFYLLFGAAAFQQSVLNWASDHRRHHLNIDEELDPYNIKRGFLWAHIGWLLMKSPQPPDYSNVPDLAADPLIRLQNRFYVPLAVAMGFGVPLAIGYAMGHPWGGLLWAGIFRTVLVHHSTFFVNSLAHTLGKRPYSIAISARDSMVTALLTFGEGYHNFHHRFATDYRNGLRHYQWDPTKWLIRTMEAIGWAWGLCRAPREKIVAAELACDTERLAQLWKAHSADALAYVSERVAEIKAAVEKSAARLGELERQLMRARENLGLEGRRQIERLRSELRAARREFRLARNRWRRAIEELYALPVPALVTA